MKNKFNYIFDIFKRKKKIFIVSVIVFLLVLLIALVIINNKRIGITTLEHSNELIPEAFNDYSIVQISDLHNEVFGENHKDLVDIVKKLNPDLIVFTGDMIDRSNNDVATVLDFVHGLKSIAPIYSVSGNHEVSIDYDNMVMQLTEAGVTVLVDEMELITIDGQSIEVIGLNDPAFLPNEEYLGNLGLENIEYVLNTFSDSENFQLLLSHRPELFDVYVEHKMELVLSGHAHGGQIRIPFVGGIIAPNQGFFPKYDAGIFEEDGTAMFVSRGLGNSIFPLRVNNNPEVVNIILKTDE